MLVSRQVATGRDRSCLYPKKVEASGGGAVVRVEASDSHRRSLVGRVRKCLIPCMARLSSRA
jgi:hypothetical protein